MKTLRALVCALAMGFGVLACGDEKGTGGTQDQGPVEDQGPTQDPGPGQDLGPQDPGSPEMVTFKAVVKDNLTKEILQGATVVAYDNETGEATQVQATSGQDGRITMQLPKAAGKMGFKVSLTGFKDTYQFNIAIDSEQEETLWAVSVNGYNMAAALAGFTPDPAKAIVAGAIYWVNNQGEEEFVGCATITSDPAGEYRYFGDTGLPAPLAQVPETTTGKGEARFVAGNVPPGKCTLKAWVKGQEVGSATLFTFADSICINNIYTEGTSNPTPADCTK